MINWSAETTMSWLDYLNKPSNGFKLSFILLPLCLAIIILWFVFSFVFGSRSINHS